MAQHLLLFGRAAGGSADTAAFPACASQGWETEPIDRATSTGLLS